MSITFLWEDKYSVGNPDIDGQHKKIFAISNSISIDMVKEEINPILMELFRYTRQHFRDEEKMMKEIGYPKVDEHRILHDDLITKLSEVSVKSFETNQSVIDFKKFVYDWITDHILVNDMDYFRFNQEKNSNKL